MRKFLLSFTYAFSGIFGALKTERNFKIQFSIGLLVVAAGLYLKISTVDWCILLFAIALVLSLELINSAIENLVNLVTQEHKPLAGRIKDLAAGAVLVASMISAIIGCLIFWQYL